MREADKLKEAALKEQEKLEDAKKKEKEEAEKRKAQDDDEAREKEKQFEDENRRGGAKSLQFALEAGNCAEIESLLQKYADGNFEDENGIVRKAIRVQQRREGDEFTLVMKRI